MFDALRARLSQGYRTGAFPPAKPNLPEHFAGRPIVSPDVDVEGMQSVCPTGALCRNVKNAAAIDIGKCIFCGKCAEVCQGISFTKEYCMGAMHRDALLATDAKYEPEAQLDRGISRLYGKSFKIRQVSAGGCAACELDFNVLNTLAWDMGRFGIQAVASPRHADAILVTGPVSQNMLLALKKTYDAMPKPCLVIASGTCAISGGIYASSSQVNAPLDGILPVDLYVPGCPPHPAVLLEALLRFLGRNS